jgi:hypothetical protein
LVDFRSKGTIHQAILAADFGHGSHLIDIWQDCGKDNGTWIIGNTGGGVFKLDHVNNRLQILDRATGSIQVSVDIPSSCAIDQPHIAAGDQTG